MLIIEIKTLIDITDSKINRSSRGSALEYNQHRNFVTLKQCVELRSNISYETDPVMELRDIKGMGFGNQYKGKHAVWTFRFSPDRPGVYGDDVSDIGCLIDDIHGVPVIGNLTESINIGKAIFDLKDQIAKNTTVMAIQGTI